MLLVPHRSGSADETAPPDDYRRILAIVRAAGGPVPVRAVGEELGLQVEVRGKLGPLRVKLAKLADRGRPHKRGDGTSTARLRPSRPSLLGAHRADVPLRPRAVPDGPNAAPSSVSERAPRSP